MDARLPLHPNLGYYRKRAKELKRALADGDAAALARLAKHIPRRSPSAGEPSLRDAQIVIAREHGYPSWAEFKTAVATADPGRQPSASDALIAAVRAGDLATVDELVGKTPGLARTPDSFGALPLVEAADRGALEIARRLLAAGSDPRAGDPILAAAHAGPHKPAPALDVVELLLASGAPDDLFTHAALGRVDRLERDLAPGDVDVNAPGPGGASALYLAAANGHVEAARLLLEAGANPGFVAGNGRSIWQQVYLHIFGARYREIARILLDQGLGCSFQEACVLGHLPTVKRLLAEEPELKDRPTEAGVAPITTAVLNADAELARLLLAAGASDPKGQGRALVEAKPQERQAFAGALYRSCSFERVNFHDCNLKNAVFSDVNLAGVCLDNVNLSGARIDKAWITGLTIYGIEVAPLLEKERARRAAARKTAK